MALHKIFDFVLHSDIPLGIDTTEGIEPEYVFRYFNRQTPNRSQSEWLHHYNLVDGQPWLSIAKQGADYLLRFPDLADFIIASNGREIRCYAGKGIPLDTIEHLFLDQVFPIVLGHWRGLVLHASAVWSSEGAIVFLGESGRGKSTLSASFCREGFPLITDDSLLLEERGGQFFGVPSYPGFRLWPESISLLFGNTSPLSRVAHYTDKSRMSLDIKRLPFCTEPVPIRAMYVLAQPEEQKSIKILPLSHREAFIELANHTYRLDITDRKRVKEEFESLSRVTASLMLYRLTFPRDTSFLPLIRRSILKASASQERLAFC